MTSETTNAKRPKIPWRALIGVVAVAVFIYVTTELLALTHGTVFPGSEFQKNSGIAIWKLCDYHYGSIVSCGGWEVETVNAYLSTNSYQVVRKWYQMENWDGHDTTWRDYYYRLRQLQIGPRQFTFLVRVSIILDTHPTQIEVSYRFVTDLPKY